MFKHITSGMGPKAGRVLGAVLVLVGLGLAPAGAWAAHASAGKVHTPSKAGIETGCRNGWRRVGTRKDATLDRSWAVVESCEHPAWPARLEPAWEWKPLPKWVPAGSRVRVSSQSTVTAMRLEGRTVSPGRVGQRVTVRLRDGARVRVKLMALDRAEMVPLLRWRQR